jgi:hypothetical protein
VFLSTDEGENWSFASNGLIGDDLSINCIAVSGTYLVAGTPLSGINLSTNNGASWTPVNSGLTNQHIYSLAFSGTDILAGTFSGGVFFSSNNGASWTARNTGFLSMNPEVTAIAVNGTDIFAGMFDGGIYLSTNSGLNWIYKGNGFPNAGNVIRSIVYLGPDVFVGIDGSGVCMSTDNGTSWSMLNYGLADLDVYSLAVGGTKLFAATFGSGIFMLNNPGTSWKAINDGLVNLNSDQLLISGASIYAGIFQYETWKRSLVLTVDNPSICAGTSATLTVQQSLGNDSATTYLWSDGSTGNSITVTPDTTTIYTVTASCDSLTDVVQSLVTVKPLPVIVASGGTICPGYNIVLTASGGDAYQWSTDDVTSAITVNPAVTTTYTITCTSAVTGCKDTAQLIVNVIPPPMQPQIIRSSDTLISDNSTGNQWYRNNIKIPGATNRYYHYTQNGSYYDVVSTYWCWPDTSNTIVVTDAGIAEKGDSPGYKLFPNPVNDELMVTAPPGSVIDIMNMEGIRISTFYCNTGMMTIRLGNISKGVYTVRIRTGKTIMTGKIIKE